MAKIKNARIAGYMISCNADGAISVAKDYENQRQALRDIAKSIGYDEYNPDWGTQQLGKKVIEQITGEHVANKDEASAVSNEYIVFKDATGPIHVFKDYDNVKGALREISEKIGFEYDTEWTTRQFGSKLIAHVNGETTTNSQKDETPNTSSACEEDSEEDKHTYYLRVEAETLWRFDTVNLENADDSDIEEGFEDQDKWTEIVGNTNCLYTQKEDLESANEGNEFNRKFFGDDDAVKHIIDMMGDNYVDDNCYYPDAEEDFSIVVMDEDEEEIETIDSSDVPSFRCEQGYEANLEDYDEEDDADEYSAMKNYLEKTCNPEQREHVFTPADEESWFWLNIQKCCVADNPVYQLEIAGEFDASKLSFKKVLVEEAISGLMSIECVTEILYDGEPLDIYEDATADEDECTNLFVKMDSDDKFPEKVYDMTNYEES